MTDNATGYRVRVWSTRLRLCHWLMAAACLALILSGWLLGASAELSLAALDYHFMAAYVLVGSLAVRLWLLVFGQATEHWHDCIARPGQWQQALQTALAYVSGGARPMPGWYGHNPLWGPLYLAWLALLVAAAWSGWARYDGAGEAGWHAGLAQTVSILVVLHLVAVVLHELRTTHGEISAMIGGFKWFQRRDSDPDGP